MKLTRIIAIISILCLIFALGGCVTKNTTVVVATVDEAKVAENNKKVEGSWLLTEFNIDGKVYTMEEYCEMTENDPKEVSMSFELKGDGTGTASFGTESINVKYVFTGKRITLTTDNGTAVFEYDQEKNAFYSYDSKTNTYGYLTLQ